jgi:phage terminase small subunit
MARDLTAKQRAFVNAYLANGMNGADAYRRAYGSKSSPQVVAVKAAELLRNGKIAVIVGEAQKRASAATERALDRYEVTREKVVSELARIGFANMQDYMRAGPDGDPYLDFSKLTPDQAAALAEVTVEDFKGGRGEDARAVRRIKFKLHDKRAALVDLGRHLQMFTDNVKHSGSIGIKRDPSALSDDELADIAAGSGEGAAGEAPGEGGLPRVH